MSGQRARFITLILSTLILFCSSAGAQEFGVPLELQKAVHFLTADGQIVKMEAGSYLLEQDELNLRLWPTSGGESLLLKTSLMVHDKPVAGPVALSIQGKGEYPDIHMVVLMLPAGEGLRGIGSYSGVMPRGLLGDVGGFFEDLGDAGGDLIDDAADVVDDVVDAGEWVVDLVDEAATEAMNLAVNTFEEVGPQALEMLDDAGDMYLQAQDLAYQAATNPNLAEDLLNQAAELAQEAAAVTAQALEDSWEAAVDAANWLYDLADQYLKEIICKAMVYIFQGMDILADLSGPAADAISEVLAPVNQAVEDVVNEAVERVGAEETLNEVKVTVQEGMEDLVPQFAFIVGMMADLQYTQQQLTQLRGLMLSTSVCELSRDELDNQMKNILDPLYERMVQLADQVETSWEEQQPVAAPVDEGEEEVVEILPGSVPFTLETVAVSSHPPIPSGLKASFRNPEGTASSTTCQVVKSGSLTCWAYSYTDNRSAFGVVAYDKDGNVVEQWEKRGARYLSRIVLHSDTQTIEFVGQADRTATMNWDEITAVQPPDVPEPPELVVIQDRPADDAELVPPAPPEELVDDPVEVEDVPVEPVVVQDKPVKDSDTIEYAPPVKIDDDPADIAETPVAPVIKEGKTPKITKTPAIAAVSTSPAVTPEPVKAVSAARLDSETKKPKTRWKRSFKTRRRGEAKNLDQDWTPRTREGQDLRAGVTMAQTFTTGKKGLLSSIALRVNRRAWSNSDLTVDIRRVLETDTPSNQSTSVLFTTTMSPGSFPIAFSETMTEIDVRSAGIFVEPGEVLAMAVTNQGTGNFTWWSQEGYDGGQGLAFENGEWIEIGSDLVFQAEIDADAPMVSTRGFWDSVDSVIDDVIISPAPLGEFSFSDFTDAAKGRYTNDVKEEKYSKTDGYRDICIGISREVSGVTVHPKNGGTGLTLEKISIEVYSSKDALEAGTPAFETTGSININQNSNDPVTFDLRNSDTGGRYVRVRTDNIDQLGNVQVWSSKDWVSGYAGVQFSGSGFLMFLHPSLKPVAMSLGFGTELPCCNPLTSFGGGLTTGDPSMEIGVQVGISKRPEPLPNALVLSGEIEFVWGMLPQAIPKLLVTSPDGVERDLLDGDNIESGQGGKSKHAAVHIDVILDAELLWEVMKSPFDSNADTCEWYKDVIQGFVLTIGRENDSPVEGDINKPWDVTALYVHTWEWLFGL